MAGAAVQWYVKRDYVRILQKEIKRRIFEAKPPREFGIAVYVKNYYVQVETSRNSCHVPPDAAQADYAEGLAVKVESCEAINRKVASHCPLVSLVDVPGKGKYERKSVFCDGVFSVRRNVHYFYFSFFAFVQINVVKTG